MESHRNRWDEHDDDFLRTNYGALGGRQVAERLGRTLAAVQVRAHQLGVKKRPGVPTREEFMALCIEHDASEIAARCGVSYQAVWQWSRKYGCRPKPGRRGGRRARIEMTRTTPNRLCRNLQPNHMEWPDWV